MSPSDIEIRVLQAADAEQFRAIRLEALRLSPHAFATSYEEAVGDDAKAFTLHIPPAGSASAVFGAFIRDAIVGMAGLYVNPQIKQRHKALLWGIYVREAARRRGVAEALIRAAIAHARAHVALIQLGVGAENARARALYDKLDFVPYGIERRSLRIDGVDHDEVLMALDLGNDL